jgi:SagB-type dehydrogenase family enzyme
MDAIAVADFRMQRHGLRRGDRGERVALGGSPPASQAHVTRRTERTFSARRCTRDQLAALLASLAEIPRDQDPLPKLRYPSAGSLYPVQVYVEVHADRVDGVPAGSYYHDRARHELVLLSREAAIARGVHTIVNQPIFDEAAFSLFLVARDAAIAPVYGTRARDFCLIEAGYMGQLLMETASEHGLGICPVGYLDFDAVGSRFALEPGQWLVHSFLIGASRQVPAELLVRDLRQLARRRLPWYMEPSSLEVLDALPLSSNGKVDRRALAELAARAPRSQAGSADSSSHQNDRATTAEGRNAEVGTAANTATSETRARVAEVMARALKLERLGEDDSFFDAGGNSLLAARVVATVRSMFGVDITLRSLFDRRSPRAFAEAIDAARASGGGSPSPAPQPPTIPRAPRKPDPSR